MQYSIFRVSNFKETFLYIFYLRNVSHGSDANAHLISIFTYDI